MQTYKPFLKKTNKKKNNFPVDQPAVQLSLHCDMEGAKLKGPYQRYCMFESDTHNPHPAALLANIS